MALVVDPYTFVANTPAVSAEVNARIAAILAQLNGNVDTANLQPAVLDKIGVSSAAVVRRGKSIIAGSDPRTNVAYGLMGSPDRVQSIVLPTDGLIAVAYQALWQESVAQAARAAIFIGANQLKISEGDVSSAPVTTAAMLPSAISTGKDVVLASCAEGLVSCAQPDTAGASQVTTGQAVGVASIGTASSTDLGIELNGTPQLITSSRGGVCYVFAAAGTYDVSVQFKASSGTVTVSNRKLWVWTMGF